MKLLGLAIKSYLRHGGNLLSGAIAFYALLSLAPILVIALYFAGLVTSEESARAELIRSLARFLGREGASTLGTLVDRFSQGDGGGLASIVQVAILVYASTRLMAALKRSINTLWDIELLPGPRVVDKIWNQVRRRLVALVMVLVIGPVLIATVIVKALLSAAASAVGDLIPQSGAWQVLEAALSFAILTVLFSSAYKILPDAKIGYRAAFVGGLLTSTLFTLGALLIGLYLAKRASLTTMFGAAGSVVLLMVFVHYASQVFFLGAAFTGVWAREHGGGITPGRGARVRPGAGEAP